MSQYSSDDIELLFQKNKRYRIKIDILDKYWHTIGTLEGTTTNLNFSIDSESEIRRVVTLTLFITDTNIVAPESMVWIDKFAKMNIGTYNFKKKRWIYYHCGRYVISNYQYKLSADESSLQLSLLDLMATLTEERGNQITTKASIPVGITVYPCPICGQEMTHTQTSTTEIIEDNGVYNPVITVIDTYTCPSCGHETNERPESTAVYADITNAMKTTVKMFSRLPYNRFSFDILRKDFSDVPYDLEYEHGTYPIKIITDLRDLYPNYQTYYDDDGVFVFSQIPTREDDPVVLDCDIMDKIIISEDKNADFKEVCNVHDVWGQSIEADRTALSTEGSFVGNRTIYRCVFQDLKTIEDGSTYCFTADITNTNGADVLFSDGTEELTTYTIPLYIRYGDDERLVQSGEIKADTPYVIKIIYHRSGEAVYKKGILLGELQIRGVCKVVSQEPSSDQIQSDKDYFACNNINYKIEADNPLAADVIGSYIKVCHGGDYDNIYSTELAYERGRYENYNSARMRHNATLTTLIVPWLDVNEKIRYTSPVTGEVLQYIIKKIDISFSDGTMTLTLTEFYPYYPFTETE